MKEELKSLIEWAEECDKQCRVHGDRDKQNFEYLLGKTIAMILAFDKEEKVGGVGFKIEEMR